MCTSECTAPVGEAEEHGVGGFCACERFHEVRRDGERIVMVTPDAGLRALDGALARDRSSKV
jgi:hypothetical protein